MELNYIQWLSGSLISAVATVISVFAVVRLVLVELAALKSELRSRGRKTTVEVKTKTGNKIALTVDPSDEQSISDVLKAVAKSPLSDGRLFKGSCASKATTRPTRQ